MQSMKRVLEDTTLQQQMIEEGCKQVNKFSWKIHTDKIISLFEDTL